jgi:ribosomal protein S18 acetylase RimI-like enzyme
MFFNTENGRKMKPEMNCIILVRGYRSEDLDDIREILLEYPSPSGRRWTENLVKEMMCDALKEQPDGIFVAEINGKIVGFVIVLRREWFNTAYLDYIQVKTNWINKGVGHELLEKCIEWARKKGTRIIYTETGRNNDEAIKFYKKHGFQITGCIPE